MKGDESMDREYPARYGSRLRVTTTDGRVLEGTFLDAPGDAAWGASRSLSSALKLLLTALAKMRSSACTYDGGNRGDRSVRLRDHFLQQVTDVFVGLPR